jgi:hypothetical protein
LFLIKPPSPQTGVWKCVNQLSIAVNPPLNLVYIYIHTHTNEKSYLPITPQRKPHTEGWCGRGERSLQTSQSCQWIPCAEQNTDFKGVCTWQNVLWTTSCAWRALHPPSNVTSHAWNCSTSTRTNRVATGSAIPHSSYFLDSGLNQLQNMATRLYPERNPEQSGANRGYMSEHSRRTTSRMLRMRNWRGISTKLIETSRQKHWLLFTHCSFITFLLVSYSKYFSIILNFSIPL